MRNGVVVLAGILWLILAPMLLIAAVNSLAGSSIPLTWKTWGAALFFLYFFGTPWAPAED